MRKYTHKLQYALLCMAILGIGLLAGCFNPAAGTEFQDESGRLEITLSGLAQGSARTLYPEANFTKYVLSFTGPGTHADVTLTDGQSSIVISDLAQGEWTITAKAYVTILNNGKSQEYEAAQGTSGSVTVGTGSQTITIPISAKQDGDPGFFSYSVSFPSTKGVTSAELRLTTIDGSSVSLPDGSSFAPVNLLTSSKSDQVSLNPGYYVLSMRLQNQYQTAGHTEVIHIYANMETKAEYTFAEGNFTDFITLSGTLNVTVDGELPSYVQIYALRSGYAQFGYTYISSPGADEPWSINMDTFEEPTEITFDVSVSPPGGGNSIYKRNIASVTVHAQSVSGIEINADIGLITLSGTLNITVNGQAPSSVEIRAYHPNYGDFGSTSISSPGADASWSIKMEPFETSREITFNTWIYPPGGGSGIYKENIASITVQDQSVSDIALNIGDIKIITLSGTVTFTNIPGTFQSVNLYSNQMNSGVSIGLGTVSDGTASGTWSITTTAFEASTDVYWRLFVSAGSNGSYTKNIPTPVSVYDQSIANIDLGTISLAPTGYLSLQLGTSNLENQLRNYVYTSGSNQVSQSSSYNYSFRIYTSQNFDADAYQWIVDGAEKTDLDGQSDVQFDAGDYALGVHYVTLMVTQNGLLGSREFSFKVVE